MVIKIRKKNTLKETIRYKSAKKILTPQDILDADSFDNALNKEIRKIETILLENKMLSSKDRKSNMLKAWHLIGLRINEFLKENIVSPEEEGFFWDYLYGRSAVINKTVPMGKISRARNDFRVASFLSRYPLDKLEKIGSWSLLREIVVYKSFRDERVLNWILKKVEQSPPRTRNEARPFLKAVSARLKKIDTTILNDEELVKKLNEVRKTWKCKGL